MRKRIISAILGTLVTSSVLADTSDYYIGASYLSAETGLVGESKYNSGYEIHLGYRINSSFSVEGSYLDLGSNDFTKSSTDYSIDTDALSISALYTYPIGRFNLIGKLGYLSYSSDVLTVPLVDYPSDFSGGGLLIGAGLSYKLNEKIEIKTEFNFKSSSNYGAIGLNYYF